MLQTFIAEQEERQARLKQQRAPRPKSKHAGVQCDWDNAVAPRQTSDVAVQTDFVDVMEDLREQVRNLTQIVAELAALKSQKQEDANRIRRGPLLTELLSDTLSELPEICQDSSENCSIATTETPLPGLQPPSADALTYQTLSNRETPQSSLQSPSADAFTLQPFSSSSPVINYASRAPLAVIQQNNQVDQRTYGPTNEQRRQVEAILFMGKQMSTTALACVDVLFSENELANGNTGGTFGYNKLDEHKMSYLSSMLHQKFDSPSFAGEWENVRAKIISKCRGKRRTVVKRLKQKASQ